MNPIDIIHDSTLIKLNWDLLKKELILELRLAIDESPCLVCFSDTHGFHLDDAVEGCIIFDIEEISCSDYLSDDAPYIKQRARYCYDFAVDWIRKEKTKVFALNSSYGLNGYIIAAQMEIRSGN